MILAILFHNVIRDNERKKLSVEEQTTLCNIPYHFIEVWDTDLVWIHYFKVLSRYQIQAQVPRKEKDHIQHAESSDYSPLFMCLEAYASHDLVDRGHDAALAGTCLYPA